LGFGELRDVLARERQRRRDEIRTALRGHAWTKLQLYLTLWPRTLGDNPRLEGRVMGHARKALRKAWKKAADVRTAPKLVELRKTERRG
jgi:hypothetical protein